MELDIEMLADYANLALTWIGFGVVVGLAAKAVMPGRDPGGTIATIMMGIAGTLIGCAFLQWTQGPQAETVKPMSLLGFSVGSGGALVLLAMYKVLGGYWFVEGEQTTLRNRRRRRFRSAYDD